MPVKQAVPLAVSTWNAFKGGADTVTGLIMGAQPPLPINSVQGTIVRRELMICFVNLHRMFQLHNIEDLEHCPDLVSMRHRVNQKRSMRRSLQDLFAIFHRWSLSFQAASPMASPEVGAAMPNKRRRNVAVVSLAEFAANAVTHDTPPRQASEHYKYHPQSQLAQRYFNCTGTPGASVNPTSGELNSRRTCFWCKMQPHKERAIMWCVGCHHFFHVFEGPSSDSTVVREQCGEAIPVPYLAIEGMLDSDRPRAIVNSCFWQAHTRSGALEASVETPSTRTRIATPRMASSTSSSQSVSSHPEPKRFRAVAKQLQFFD